MQAAEALNRCNLERSSSTSLGSAGSRKRAHNPHPPLTPEVFFMCFYHFVNNINKGCFKNMYMIKRM